MNLFHLRQSSSRLRLRSDEASRCFPKSNHHRASVRLRTTAHIQG
jgi:hypothetical protein